MKPSIYVYGDVEKPGRHDWFPGMTVMDAIQAAGGIKGSNSHMVRINRIADGHTIRITFQADKFSYGVKKPPLLKEGDIVSAAEKVVE